MAMHVINHVSQPSACTQSLVLRDFWLPDQSCLAVVRHSYIDLYSLPSGSGDDLDALSLIYTAHLNARILHIAPLPTLSSDRHSRLLVLTDHHNARLIVLRRCTSSQGVAQHSLETEAAIRLDEMGRIKSEYATGLVVEPRQIAYETQEAQQYLGPRLAVAHCHQSVLKVVPAVTKGVAPTNINTRSSSSTGKEAIFPGKLSIDQTFSVRLPHPTLLSMQLLAPSSKKQPPTLALLSLSSTPTSVPGLGSQALPVLSFHAVDLASRELIPMPWSSTRTLPEPLRPKQQPDDESFRRDTGSSPRASMSMPGSFDSQETHDIESNTTKTKSRSRLAPKGRLPGAFGKIRSASQERRADEELSTKPLTRAHVPLPVEDALGAHLVVAVPARAGSGVVVFSETSVTYIPPPPMRTASRSGSSVSSKLSNLPGKRRKSSSGAAPLPVATRRSSGSGVTPTDGSALSLSPPTAQPDSAPVHTLHANENGKRRRSSAMTADANTNTVRSDDVALLRASFNVPVQVVSAIAVEEVRSLGRSPGAESSNSCHILYGTHAGHLNLLTLHLEAAAAAAAALPSCSFRPERLTVRLLGNIPPPGGPGGLSYLGEGFVHVSSAVGDSILVHVSVDEGTAESSLTEVERRPNLAPILDFHVDDGAGNEAGSSSSAQSRIITCSGAGPTGSIRVVRNGVAIDELARLEEPQALRMWAIDDDRITRLLVLSFVSSTRILAIETHGLTDVTESFTPMGLDNAALSVSSLQDGRFVIVTSRQISLCRVGFTAPLAIWSPSTESRLTGLLGQSLHTIDSASSNDAGQVLLALRGGRIFYLQCTSHGIEVIHSATLESEISSLDIHSLDALPHSPAQVCAVGLWAPSSVRLLALPSLTSVWPATSEDSLLAAVPRSILLHSFSHRTSKEATQEQAKRPYLLIGLGDGSLTSCSLSLPNSESLSQTIATLDRKNVSVGAHALRLEPFETALGLHAVFVASDRPSVLSLNESAASRGINSARLTFSAVRFSHVRSVSSLRMLEQPPILAMALPSAVQIVRIGEIGKLDVQSIPLGVDNPWGITRCAASKTLSVITWPFSPTGLLSSSKRNGNLIVYDESDLKELSRMALPLEMRPTCITSMTIEGNSHIIVGLGQDSPNELETTKGAIVLYRNQYPSSETATELVLYQPMAGNVSQILVVGGRLIVAINSLVRVYEMLGTTSLRKIGEWGSAMAVCSLASAIDPSMVLVGDAIRSLVLLRIEASGTISEIARDSDPFWTAACAEIDGPSQTYVGADVALNLFTTQRMLLSKKASARVKAAKMRSEMLGRANEDPWPSSNDIDIDATSEWSHVLARAGRYHYGDMINRMKGGCLVPRRHLPLSPTRDELCADPRLIFATAAGALGIMARVEQQSAHLATQVERNIQALNQPLGDIHAEEWRSFRTDHRTALSAGFLDGDVLQTYTSLSAGDQARVLAGPLGESSRIEAPASDISLLVQAIATLQ